MSRVCELTGKTRMTGNNVSHANNRTRRVFLPNLQVISFISEAMDQTYRFRVAASGARSVEHAGGLDAWLLKTRDDQLSLRARRLKRQIAKKASDASVAA